MTRGGPTPRVGGAGGNTVERQRHHSTADHWLGLGPPEELWAFLQDDFRSLAARYSEICGLKYRRPRIVPVAHAQSAYN